MLIINSYALIEMGVYRNMYVYLKVGKKPRRPKLHDSGKRGRRNLLLDIFSFLNNYKDLMYQRLFELSIF